MQEKKSKKNPIQQVIVFNKKHLLL